MSATTAGDDGTAGSAPGQVQGHCHLSAGVTQGRLTIRNLGHRQPERAVVGQGHDHSQGVTGGGQGHIRGEEGHPPVTAHNHADLHRSLERARQAAISKG